MLIEIMLLIGVPLLTAFIWFRFGKQNAINELIEAYNKVCKDNREKQIIINHLKEQLKSKKDKQ